MRKIPAEIVEEYENKSGQRVSRKKMDKYILAFGTMLSNSTKEKVLFVLM